MPRAHHAAAPTTASSNSKRPHTGRDGVDRVTFDDDDDDDDDDDAQMGKRG
jgi:hypothetical protein